jgi:hypothetical protein
LKRFSLVPRLGTKREKAVARFQNEAEARSASALNNTTLGVLGKGKLTIILVQSVKVKVPTAAYSVSRSMIKEEMKYWTQQHLTFYACTDSLRPFTTLKVKG